MLIKEIIQRIQSLYSKGVQSDDTRLTDRHIYNKMVTVRSKLVSQEAKKKQKINQWSYQTLSCVELIKAQPNECPCIAPPGCEILRSKYPIPKMVMLYSLKLLGLKKNTNHLINTQQINLIILLEITTCILQVEVV